MKRDTLRHVAVLAIAAVVAVDLSTQFVAAADNVAKPKAAGAGSATKQGPTTRPARPVASQPVKLTVKQIVDRTNYVAYYQGADGRAEVKMTVVGRNGHKRRKEFIILRRDQPPAKATSDGKAGPDAKAGKDVIDRKTDEANCGPQKFYVYFQSPPDDNRTTYLVWKHLKTDDDRWLYLPNLDLVKRVAATDKRTSFVGSHFFYEDVSGRHRDEDVHKLIKTTDTYYVLRNTPKNPKSVEFAYYDMYILKDSFLPVYIWYFDANGRKYREYSVMKWDRDKKFGYATVRKARMADSNIGGYTDVEYIGVRYNIHLPDSLFTERFLRRAPYRYLK